jgi:hypothetical protein
VLIEGFVEQVCQSDSSPAQLQSNVLLGLSYISRIEVTGHHAKRRVRQGVDSLRMQILNKQRFDQIMSVLNSLALLRTIIAFPDESVPAERLACGSHTCAIL